MNKEYVLGWKEAPESISINMESAENEEYVLEEGGRLKSGFASILNEN